MKKTDNNTEKYSKDMIEAELDFKNKFYNILSERNPNVRIDSDGHIIIPMPKRKRISKGRTKKR